MNAIGNTSYCTKEDLHSLLSEFFGALMKKQDTLGESLKDLSCQQQQLRNSVEAMSASFTSRLDSTDTRVADLVQRADIIECSIHNLQAQVADHSPTSFSHDDILLELEDRNRRATNVIMFDVPEASDHGLEQVRSILEPLAILSTPLNCARIGGHVKPRHHHHFEAVGRLNPRPLVVTFNSKSEALQVLKNRHKLKLDGRPIQVKSDQTRMQRDQLAAARADLENRRRRGEVQWTIKFQRGVPRVVEIGVNPT